MKIEYNLMYLLKFNRMSVADFIAFAADPDKTQTNVLDAILSQR